MSVSISVNLPAQPSSSVVDGAIAYIPLGGDGYEAPHSMFQGVVNLDADASGGTQTISIFADPRFQSMVQFFTTNTAAPAADKVVQWFCQPSNNAAGVYTLARTCANLARCGLAMTPPLVMPWANWSVQQGNVDTEDMFLDFTILNYAIDCTHKVPLNIILASIPQAGLISPTL